jgi:GTP-binding protein YchF
MGFSCGIIGLPNVGKSTIFNGLTSARAAASNYPFCTIDPNIGVVEVPDERLMTLAEILQPPKVSHTTLEFRDIAGLVEGAHEGKGRGNQFLSHIRNVDVIASVVRCFQDPDVVHVDGEINPIRDMEVLETELILADLQLLEKRLERVSKAVKSHEKSALLELELLERLEKALDEGRRAAGLKITPEETARLADLHLLTRKPFFYVANVGEEDPVQPGPELTSAESRAREEGIELVVICGKVEAEVLDLPEEERDEYLRAFGLERSSLENLIEVGYRLLNLVTFYTVVGRELRAWTVPAATPAPVAAGKIHSDMERGFIRADVVAFNDFQALGSLTKAREEGWVRSEGKGYRIGDGDIVTFRFKS